MPASYQPIAIRDNRKSRGSNLVEALRSRRVSNGQPIVSQSIGRHHEKPANHKESLVINGISINGSSCIGSHVMELRLRRAVAEAPQPYFASFNWHCRGRRVAGSRLCTTSPPLSVGGSARNTFLCLTPLENVSRFRKPDFKFRDADFFSKLRLQFQAPSVWSPSAGHGPGRRTRLSEPLGAELWALWRRNRVQVLDAGSATFFCASCR